MIDCSRDNKVDEVESMEVDKPTEQVDEETTEGIEVKNDADFEYRLVGILIHMGNA